jgi:hypothetical protein
MTRLLFAAVIAIVLPFTAMAQTAPETPRPGNAELTAQKKAAKKEEIAREKANASTPLDPKAAMETRAQIKQKRAACKQEAKDKKLGLMERHSFRKTCEAG